MAMLDFGGSKLRRRKLLEESDSEPMGSLGNLMDVMLVFVCGLLLALVANWNVDLSESSSASDGNIKELDGDLEAVEQGIQANDGSYTSLGTVYRDEETGQLYVVQN